MKQWWRKWQWLIGIGTFVGFLLIAGITFGGEVVINIINSEATKEIPVIQTQVALNKNSIRNLKLKQKESSNKLEKNDTWHVRQEQIIISITEKLEDVKKSMDDKFESQQRQLNRMNIVTDKILDVLLNGIKTSLNDN